MSFLIRFLLVLALFMTFAFNVITGAMASIDVQPAETTRKK